MSSDQLRYLSEDICIAVLQVIRTRQHEKVADNEMRISDNMRHRQAPVCISSSSEILCHCNTPQYSIPDAYLLHCVLRIVKIDEE